MGNKADTITLLAPGVRTGAGQTSRPFDLSGYVDGVIYVNVLSASSLNGLSVYLQQSPDGNNWFGSPPNSNAGSSASTVGSVTSPGALGVITSQALAAGQYDVDWAVDLAGTLAAVDANNFGLYVGSSLIATSLNPSSVGPAQPAVPATGVAVQNNNTYSCKVVIGANGATITNVTVNGITVGVAAGTYSVPPAGSISIAYTVATPTWVWSNQSVAAVFPQPTEEVVIPTGGATLAVQAIAAGTTGAVYTAQLDSALTTPGALPFGPFFGGLSLSVFTAPQLLAFSVGRGHTGPGQIPVLGLTKLAWTMSGTSVTFGAIGCFRAL